MTIKHTIAIHSCKGGVGKSTITCLLAKILKNRGLSVGICDLDISGPCLKNLIPPGGEFVKWITKGSVNIKYDQDSASSKDPLDILDVEEDTILPKENQFLEPLTVDTIRLMSISFLKSPKSAGFTAFRGPANDQICQILLKKTDWGDLDYLLLDLPPGTMDVILSASEHITINGAIAITTPHELSQKTTERGIRLFKHLGIQTVALIENMAYFQCGDSKHFLFGKPIGVDLCEIHKIPKYIQLPLINNDEILRVDDFLENPVATTSLGELINYLTTFNYVTKSSNSHVMVVENNFDW